MLGDVMAEYFSILSSWRSRWPMQFDFIRDWWSERWSVEGGHEVNKGKNLKVYVSFFWKEYV